MAINSLSGFIIILLILLVAVVVIFALLDRWLKGGFKKSKEKSDNVAKTVPVEKTKTEPVAATQQQPVMKIYNSELADDLNTMIKSSGKKEHSRLQIENHVNKESNIAKYLQSKHYQSFNFGAESETATDDAEPLTFTSEDYKRIMALSNIDDKKSL